MANNPYVNKVTYDGNTLIDLTSDDTTAEYVASGKKFHLASGQQATGTAGYTYSNEEMTVPSWAVVIE